MIRMFNDEKGAVIYGKVSTIFEKSSTLTIVTIEDENEGESYEVCFNDSEYYAMASRLKKAMVSADDMIIVRCAVRKKEYKGEEQTNYFAQNFLRKGILTIDKGTDKEVSFFIGYANKMREFEEGKVLSVTTSYKFWDPETKEELERFPVYLTLRNTEEHPNRVELGKKLLKKEKNAEGEEKSKRIFAVLGKEYINEKEESVSYCYPLDYYEVLT